MLSVKNAGRFVKKELCFKSFYEFRANIQLTMFKVWLFLKKSFLEEYMLASVSAVPIGKNSKPPKNQDNVRYYIKCLNFEI